MLSARSRRREAGAVLQASATSGRRLLRRAPAPASRSPPPESRVALAATPSCFLLDDQAKPPGKAQLGPDEVTSLRAGQVRPAGPEAGDPDRDRRERTWVDDHQEPAVALSEG